MQNFERKATYVAEEILPIIGGEKKADKRTNFDGHSVHVSGLRLATFKEKGIQCVTCGITGMFFALERAAASAAKDPKLPFHFNLYAHDADGLEVLMTHDHIISRANGGADNLSNAQPMCSPCNGEKGRLESVPHGRKTRA